MAQDASESLFLAEQSHIMLPIFRVLAGFGIIAVLAFGVWDVVVAPEVIAETMAIRVALSALIACLLSLTFSAYGRRHWPALVMALTVFGVGGIAAVLAVIPNGFEFGTSGLLYMIAATIMVTPTWKYSISIYIVSVAIPNIVMFLYNESTFIIVNANFFLVSFCFIFGAMYYQADTQRRRAFRTELELDTVRKRNEAMLRDMLPGDSLERVRRGEQRIADRYETASVAFLDIVGFTELTSTIGPSRLVSVLDDLFKQLDVEASRQGVEKIKTVGDAYMVASGVAGSQSDTAQVAQFAIAAQGVAARIADQHGLPIVLHAGVASGDLVGGVIGVRRPQFDLWGATVNRASRLQVAAQPGETLIDAQTYQRLANGWRCAERGELSLKGLGKIRAWRLEGCSA